MAGSIGAARMRDIDVRKAVRRRLLEEHDGDTDTRIVEEMGIWHGSVRVDMAVINGELSGYELKSARDTLQRLPSQAKLYSEVFDRVHLVTAEKHLKHAIADIPAWWGVIVARSLEDVVNLELLREGERNPEVEAIQVARLLWKDEALAILQRHDAIKGVRSATREKVSARLAAVLALDVLRNEVRATLKARSSWLGQPVSHQADVAIGSVFGPFLSA